LRYGTRLQTPREDSPPHLAGAPSGALNISVETCRTISLDWGQQRLEHCGKSQGEGARPPLLPLLSLLRCFRCCSSLSKHAWQPPKSAGPLRPAVTCAWASIGQRSPHTLSHARPFHRPTVSCGRRGCLARRGSSRGRSRRTLGRDRLPRRPQHCKAAAEKHWRDRQRWVDLICCPDRLCARSCMHAVLLQPTAAHQVFVQYNQSRDQLRSVGAARKKLPST
jgi:hypothetical protein